MNEMNQADQTNQEFSSLDYLIKVTNKVCGLEIRTKSRKKEIIFARTFYYGLARRYTKYSLFDIGKSVKRNHATVLFSLKNLERDIINNKHNGYDIKWDQANMIIKESFKNTGSSRISEDVIRVQLQILHDQNQDLLRTLKELSGESMPEDEKRLLELFRMLGEEDKRNLILKAEITIKMKSSERRPQIRQRAELADAEI